MNYLTRKLKKTQQLFTSLFKNSAFFMQGQMDIYPESRWYNAVFVEKTGGIFPLQKNGQRKLESLEPWDNTRRDMITLLLRTICAQNIQGELAELGVYKGYTAKLIHSYIPERALHLFDTFNGFPKKSMIADKEKANSIISKKLFTDTSLQKVKIFINSKNNNIHFYKGYFPDTIPEGFGDHKFAFVHLDADLYEPTLAGLEFFYPRMSQGGFMLIHDYNAWIGARKAVDQFFDTKKEIPIAMPDKSGSALIQIQ